MHGQFKILVQNESSDLTRFSKAAPKQKIIIEKEKVASLSKKEQLCQRKAEMSSEH